MEALLGLAKAIPPDHWLVMSVLVSAAVIGLDSLIAHVVEHDRAEHETHADADGELLSR
ncbi:hypothetical protein MSZK_46390 [Mycobacterium sp. shizuoka-1]|nr:hypothetical protein MSZK_46390 [Mycobacterium sp. shizuoka-1]